LEGSQAAAILTFSHRCSVEPATWWPDMGVERATSRIVMNFPGEEEGRIELVRAPEDARVEV
jgi:hypothetical protein